MLALALRDTVLPLRLDLARIRVDEAARPSQWVGAHAVGARVSLRRRGGAADWLDLFRAAGDALAVAYGPPPHARDAAFAGAAGALLAGLLLDAGFLARRPGVDKRDAADLVRALALRELFRLRASAAALRVAVEVERGTSGATWHEAHREALTLAARAGWPAGLAARDADADVHRARLRGAAIAARLRAALVERHDVDWWRNPRAAEGLGAMLAAGAEPAPPEREPERLRDGADALVARLA
jgi:hypothetical protein